MDPYQCDFQSYLYAAAARIDSCRHHGRSSTDRYYFYTAAARFPRSSPGVNRGSYHQSMIGLHAILIGGLCFRFLDRTGCCVACSCCHPCDGLLCIPFGCRATCGLLCEWSCVAIAWHSVGASSCTHCDICIALLSAAASLPSSVFDIALLSAAASLPSSVFDIALLSAAASLPTSLRLHCRLDCYLV